jgi:hypothetical protein
LPVLRVVVVPAAGRRPDPLWVWHLWGAAHGGCDRAGRGSRVNRCDAWCLPSSRARSDSASAPGFGGERRCRRCPS